MEPTEFKNICRNENLESKMISDISKELSSLAIKELNEDILRISIKEFFSESRSAPQHDCPREETGNIRAYCSTCRTYYGHVCGLHGFGMEPFDYCASCEGRGSLAHLASVIRMFLFSRDMGLKIGYNSRARLKRYKEIYGLN